MVRSIVSGATHPSVMALFEYSNICVTFGTNIHSYDNCIVLFHTNIFGYLFVMFFWYKYIWIRVVSLFLKVCYRVYF